MLDELEALVELDELLGSPVDEVELEDEDVELEVLEGAGSSPDVEELDDDVEVELAEVLPVPLLVELPAELLEDGSPVDELLVPLELALVEELDADVVEAEVVELLEELEVVELDAEEEELELVPVEELLEDDELELLPGSSSSPPFNRAI